MAKQSGAQKRTVGRVMHEFKHGELKSGSGRKVRNPKQAIAIGLSEAGASRKQSSGEKRRAQSRTQQRERSGRTAAQPKRARSSTQTKRRTTTARRSEGPTRKELYAQATKRGITGRSRMSKDELARTLKRKR